MERALKEIILLHSNDIHGQIDKLARMTTIVDQVRDENPNKTILYMDAGDSQDTSNLLSDLSKGVAMHRLLRVAGCQAATLGNNAPSSRRSPWFGQLRPERWIRTNNDKKPPRSAGHTR